MAPSYPNSIPLSSGENRPIRGLYSNVTNAVHNPQLDSLSKDGEWPPVPEESGPSSKAPDAPGVQSGLSKQNVQALAGMSPDSASQGHNASSATRHPANSGDKSVSSSGSSCLPGDKSPNGTVNVIDPDHEVSHMAPWVDDSLDGLDKK
ncbi:hypothetical protein J3F83DRAFT_67611 [Trichoderma novae-zelandiae]